MVLRSECNVGYYIERFDISECPAFEYRIERVVRSVAVFLFRRYL